METHIHIVYGFHEFSIYENHVKTFIKEIAFFTSSIDLCAMFVCKLG